MALEASVTGGGSYAYNWSPANAFVDPTIEDAVFIGNTTPGNYQVTLTVTDLATGCQDSDMLGVEVVPLPDFTATASSNEICEGEQVMFDFTETGGNNLLATLTLTIDDGSPDLQVFSNIGADFQLILVEGVHFNGDVELNNIQLTYGSGDVFCTSNLSDISVEAIENVDIASVFTLPVSNGGFICSGDDVSVAFNSSVTGTIGVDYDFELQSVEYDLGNTGSIDGTGYGPVNGQLSAGQTVNNGIVESLTNTDNTTMVRVIYQVVTKLQNAPFCQSDVETVEVLIGQGLATSVTMPDLICIDDAPFNLVATPPGGTFSGTGVTDADLGTFDPSTVDPGSYIITYEGDIMGCPYSTTTTVDVGPIIQLGSIGMICENNPPVLIPAVPFGGVFAGSGITNVNTGEFDPGVAGVGMHIISYTTTDPSSCTGTVTTTITVNPAPDPMLNVPSPICSDDAPVQLIGTPSGGQFFGVGVSTDGMLDPAAISGNSTVVTYIVTNSFNCTESIQQVVQIVSTPANVTIVSNGPFCSNGNPVNLVATPSGGTFSGTGITNAALGTFDPSLVGIGSTVITYEATNAPGCSASVTKSLTVEDCTIITPTITNDSPLITDPCTCIGDNLFAEAIAVISNPGETWEVVSSTLTDPNSNQFIQPGTSLLPLIGNPNTYVLDGEHESGIGYTISVQRTSNPLAQPLTINNLCYYPEVDFEALESHYCVGEPAVPLQFDAGGVAGTASFFLNFAPLNPPVFDPGTLSPGFYTIRLEFDAGPATPFDQTDPGCVTTVEQNVYVSTSAGALGCNDTINLSLNTDCFAVITPDLIQEGGDPQDNVFIQIKDENDVMLPSDTVTGAYIGQYLEVSLVDACGNNNSCWGVAFVEDKFIPNLICQDYEIECFQPDTPGVVVQFPVPNDVTITETGVNTYQLDGFDSCGPATLTYSDALQQPMCAGPYSDIITRTWVATDGSGNQSSCVETIRLLRGSLDDVIPPANFDGIDQPFLNCADAFLRLPNGAPDPSVTGFPDGSFICSTILATYSDLEFPACGGSQEFLRRWIVTDWCTGDIREINQIIKIKDMTAPTITCPADITAGTGFDDCLAYVTLPDPTIVDDCSGFSYSVDVSAGTVIDYGNNNYVLTDLPLGTHTITYTAMDDCGNTSSCTFSVEALDNAVPTVVCDNPTVVSLLPNGTAFINAPTFDDGSFDNCGEVFFKARRMTTGGCDDLNADDDATIGGNQEYFDDQVGFCCADVGTGTGSVMVIFRVYDVDPGPGPVKPSREEPGGDLNGRFNDCMVEVEVQDKAPAFLSCPPDITVSCDFWFDQNNLSSVFGTVVTSTTAQQDIVIDDPGQPGYSGPVVVGQDGFSTDLCGVTISETPIINLTCGQGTIQRIFTATDAGGNQSTCIQRITIVNYDPLTAMDITFPPDITIDGCAGSPNTDPSNTGMPTWTPKNCINVAASPSDQVFASSSNCLLILRTWTVINHCPGAAGPFTDIQSIEVKDEDAPVFLSNCNDQIFCGFGDFCTGQVDLVANASDCAPDSELIWEYKIDINNDDPGNSFDQTGNTNDASGVYPVGTHEILWIVRDPCGNQSTCSYLFTVDDCLEPTAICPTGVSTQVIGPNNEVMLHASSLDFGSKDNCTADADLIFSFSPDTSDQTITYTCDSLTPPTRIVNLFVTDEAGNQSSCPVEVEVIDAIPSTCTNIPLSTALVMGDLENEMGQEVDQVEVMLNDTLMYYTADSNAYIFANLQTQNQYEIVPFKDINHGNGVSTFDVVLIRRHILRLDTLDSPYKIIAADANNSGTISTFDIVHITKIILNEWDSFPQNTSWRFVDLAYQFPDPINPWTEVFPESYMIPSLQSDMFDVDFVAIKVGDVNGSAMPDQFAGNQSRTLGEALPIEVEDIQFEKGDVIRIPVRSPDFADVFGIQFGMSFDPEMLSFDQVYNQQLSAAQLVVGQSKVNQGHLSFSWASGTALSLGPDETLFEVAFTAQANGRLSEVLYLDPSLIRPEAYRFDSFELSGIEWQFKAPQTERAPEGFRLLQNRPNPFKDETVIAFFLPQADEVKLSVFDTNGRLIVQKAGTFSEGYQEWSIDRSSLGSAGIYYYQIETSSDQALEKMILQE